MKTTFNEVQQFRQWWLWLILIGAAIIPVIGLYKQLFLGENFGDNPSSDSNLIAYVFIMLVLLVLFWFMRLTTEINQTEISMSYFPFVKKRVNWRDVKRAEVVNYGFVGGWGIRLWTKYGTVYNTSGNKGLAIELNTGKKFLIGTQKEDELKRIVNILHRI